MTKIVRMPHLQADVLGLLLDGDDPVLRTLRAQLNMARVESLENTGSGFFMKFVLPEGAPVMPGELNFQFGDVEAQIEGLSDGAGFVIFVRNGCLSVLEGYAYEEPWPDGNPRFSLSYSDGGNRRLEELAEAWTNG